ncbi:hypothetical protein GCM10022200_20050 [Microbacterium awajiense]|uniref:Small multidrug efflux protein n=1 Tax=Microbacterium awajiense TaxID=415214 RepID=A0ABP7AP44_9MICO
MDLIDGLQNLMSHVPLIVQPLIVLLAAAIPFVEGEIASVLGVWAGLNPFVAFAAAVTGNFLSVFVVVVFGARIRAAIVARRAHRRELVLAGGHASGVPALAAETKPESKGRQRFRRFLVRFGVPGASILGPLALPTQFTSAMLVASGVSKSWILLWQGVAIVLWTALTTAATVGVLALIGL